MPRLDFNGVLQAFLALLTAAVVGGLGIALYQDTKVQHLTMAAGAASGESFILGTAIQKVVARRYPKIQIAVLQTGGTVENLRMLSDGTAQLAAAQADVLPGPDARLMAVLYDDTFQLLVPKESRIGSFADLRGMHVALAENGGQFQSFLRVAEHFGLQGSDFRFVGANDEAADEAFTHGRAEALFRVRALGNPSIQDLVHSGKVRFLAIEHAAAMKIKYPAFEPVSIPEGAYLGNPPIPSQNLPTVAVHRTLLARDTVNSDAVRAITSVLMERRQEIMEEIPAQMAVVRLLLAQVRRPDSQAGLGPPVHPGALSYFDKDKPSFLHANADYVGLLITVMLMAGSWIWELKQWVQKKQKNVADSYINQVVETIHAVEQAESRAVLDGLWQRLLTILTDAVRDFDADKFSEESFHSFRSILQIGMDASKERRVMLSSRISNE